MWGDIEPLRRVAPPGIHAVNQYAGLASLAWGIRQPNAIPAAREYALFEVI